MAERVDSFVRLGHTLAMDLAGDFDVDANGRITRWHEYADIQSLTNQTESSRAETSQGASRTK